MTHIRYWAMTLATALAGAFIVIERFAFGAHTVAWVTFGVAIAAAVLSLGAFAQALGRRNHAFSALSALAILVAAWTVIAMRTFTGGSMMWLAFASGLALLGLSLRALALHETTIERVVHALQPSAEGAATQPVGESAGAMATAERAASAVSSATGSATIGSGMLRSRPGMTLEEGIGSMRPWLRWIAHVSVGIAGAFVVLITFALTTGGHQASVRWIAFGVAIGAGAVALGALGERGMHRHTGVLDGSSGRLSAMGVFTAQLATAIALIVTMLLYSGNTAQWVAFALGCGLAGFATVGLGIHEMTSERVRHELELRSAAPASAGVVPSGV